jgi:hypothetical protein
LIVIFILVATAGKFLPHEGHDQPVKQPQPRSGEAAAKGGNLVPSSHRPSSAHESRPGGVGRPDQDWLEASRDQVGVFFREAAAKSEQQLRFLLRDGWPSAKKQDWKEVLGLSSLLGSMAEQPRSEERTAKLSPSTDNGPIEAESTSGAASTIPAATSGKDLVFNNPWDHSVDQVVRYLKRHTHDADSMEFLEWGKVKSSEWGYQVRCRFRSKNVLGRYAIQSKLFLLDKQGNVMEIQD